MKCRRYIKASGPKLVNSDFISYGVNPPQHNYSHCRGLIFNKNLSCFRILVRDRGRYSNIGQSLIILNMMGHS